MSSKLAILGGTQTPLYGGYSCGGEAPDLLVDQSIRRDFWVITEGITS